MMVLIQLVKRNVLLYLRDRASVFFSFLSVIIIVIMYALFLGNMQINNLGESLGNLEGIDWLVSSWIMAGILTVSTVTVPLGVLGTLIHDRESGRINDFYISPIERKILALSYLMSSWVVAFFMVLLNLVIGLFYVLLNGGVLFDVPTFIKILGLMVISIMAFSSLFFFISLFMKSQNAFSLLSTLVGTFIGFLGGIYIPIGSLGRNVQNIMNLLPSVHSVTLIRRVYMRAAIDNVFKGAPIEAYNEYANIYGLNLQIGHFTFSSFQMLLTLIVFGISFYLLSVAKLSKTKL
ncbi:MAG: ABC transporter permease [Spirochaetaceae bacterium]|nr:ABC transporter permease [Spirochaetaceae bacterium]